MKTKKIKMKRIKRIKQIERVRFKATKPRKTMSFYRRMLLNAYMNKYRKKFNKLPLPPFVLRQIEQNDGRYRKYDKMINEIIEFLLDLRDEHKAWNEMNQLLNDWFSVIFSYYSRFNRTPNMNQMGVGATNVGEFIGWVDREEYEKFGYWMEKETIEKGKEIITNPNKYRADDPFMDKMRMQSGLEPYWRKNRTLSPNGEIVEDGIEKIYSPIGTLLESNPL